MFHPARHYRVSIPLLCRCAFTSCSPTDSQIRKQQGDVGLCRFRRKAIHVDLATFVVGFVGYAPAIHDDMDLGCQGSFIAPHLPDLFNPFDMVPMAPVGRAIFLEKCIEPKVNFFPLIAQEALGVVTVFVQVGHFFSPLKQASFDHHPGFLPSRVFFLAELIDETIFIVGLAG